MPQHLITHSPYFALKLMAVLGCGLVAGVFFAFSTFVMAALARLSPPQGIAAMQAINITVINPWFMGVFFGTAILCLALAIMALLKWSHPGSPYVLLGSFLYLVGSILVTLVGNVPLNDALAIANPDSPDSASLWATYLTRWTLWNHVRTLASLAAAAVYAMVLR